MLKIQDELRSGKTLAEICDPLGITHKEQDGKVILTYDQIESFKVKDHPIVKECRGLVLYTDNWDIACYPFERFFNLNEPGADTLPEDLYGCLVLEKLDGSLLNLWWDRINNKWNVSTRKMMCAEGCVNDLTDKTFAQLFAEAMESTSLKKYMELEQLPIEFTYCFELTSPLNRIVTRYDKTSLTLLTIRNNEELYELHRWEVKEMSESLNVPLVKATSLNNWEAILKMDVDPLYEGYVIVKEHFPNHLRVKVKNPAYLAISKITSSHSQRAFMELVKKDEGPEFLAYFEEYTEIVMGLENGLKKIEEITTKDWIELSEIKNQKEFALVALKCKFPSLLFALKNQRTDIFSLGGYIRELRTDSLLEMVEKVNK